MIDQTEQNQPPASQPSSPPSAPGPNDVVLTPEQLQALLAAKPAFPISVNITLPGNRQSGVRLHSNGKIEGDVFALHEYLRNTQDTSLQSIVFWLLLREMMRSGL